MSAALVPDTLAALLTHLRVALAARPEPVAAGVAVRRVLPDPRPDRAVTIRDDGGPRLDQHRARGRYGVTVWAESEAAAADLSALVSAILSSASGVGHIRSIRASMGAAVADSSGHPSRYLTVEAILRGGNL